MARIRICSECRKPVAECICDDEPEAGAELAMADGDGTWSCPGCGLPDDDLPAGHSLAIPMNGDAPSCSVITATLSPEAFTAIPKPPWMSDTRF